MLTSQGSCSAHEAAWGKGLFPLAPLCVRGPRRHLSTPAITTTRKMLPLRHRHRGMRRQPTCNASSTFFATLFAGAVKAESKTLESQPRDSLHALTASISWPQPQQLIAQQGSAVSTAVWWPRASLLLCDWLRLQPMLRTQSALCMARWRQRTQRAARG